VLLSPEAINLDDANRAKLQAVANAEPLAEATIQKEANLLCNNHGIHISKCHANSAQISIAGISIEDARKCASDVFDLISRLTRNE
jgi:hypothetical protein